MTKVKRLSIVNHVTLLFGLVCVILLAIGAFLFFSLRAIEHKNELLENQVINEWTLNNDIAGNVRLEQNEILQYVKEQDVAEWKHHELIISSIKKTNEGKWNSYGKLVDNETEARLYATALEDRNKYFETTDALLALSRAHKQMDARDYVLSTQAPAYDEYQKAVDKIVNWTAQEGGQMATASTALIGQTKSVGNALVLIALFVTVGTGLALIRVTRRLKEDNAALQTEVAERGRVEKMLRKSEESLRLLNSAVLQSKESILITDAELDMPGPGIIFVNPAFTQMTGYTAEEVIGKTPRILQGPHTDQAILRRLRQNLERGEVFAGETINYRKDGKEFDLEWQVAPIRDDSGKITNFVAIQRDISERKRTDTRFRRLVDSNVQGVFFWGKTGVITEANDAFLSLVRRTRADLEAGLIDWAAMTPPEYDHLDRRALDEIAANGSCTPYEKEFLLSDGSRVPVLLGAASFKDTPDEGVCFMLDISDRKRLEASMLQSQKMETVGKLAGGIAHEFNSILTAIIGQSESLLGELPAGGELAKSATEIRKAADHAANLTRQLLAFGRKQILQPEVLDLNVVLTGMKDILSHLIGKGSELRLVPAAGLKPVKIDPSQIEQVIVNITMNAAEAMPNGGKLTIETKNVTLDEEYVRAFPELKPGGYTLLAMTDTGVGMSEKVKARVFEPFFSTKGVGEGTGLGLATCFGILKQSGGHLSVYSEVARGATFKIYLPQIELPTTTPLLQALTPDLPHGTETILLAEDDPFLLSMSAAFLKKLGYTVITAANGVEALSLKHQPNVGHVDVLLTDVVMPHMSGKELADRIRAIFPHTKILFTSAYTENAIVHQGVLNEGVKFLQKPFTPAALANKLREVLDR